MTIKWLILTIISMTSLCVCRYVYFDEKVSFDAAVMKCKDRGMELAMASTKQTYHALLEFIKALSIDEEGLWFGLEYSSTVKRYRWLNDDLLVRGDWYRLQAEDKECVTMKYGNYKWATRQADRERPVICEDPGKEPQFILFRSNVNCTVAQQLCANHSYRFPVVRDETDRLALINFMQNESISRDVFLGVEKTEAGNFQWLDGVDVEYYAWQNITNCPLNINIQHDGFYCGENVSRPYICENNVSSFQALLFTKMSAAVNISASPITETSVLVKTQCAMLCNLNSQCYYFTFNLHYCKHYGNITYTAVPTGVNLWWKASAAVSTATGSIG